MNKLVEGNLACKQVRRWADAYSANSCPILGCPILPSRCSICAPAQGHVSPAVAGCEFSPMHFRQDLSHHFKPVVWANAPLPSIPKHIGERPHKPYPWLSGWRWWQRTMVSRWAQWCLPAGSGGRGLSIGFDFVLVYAGKSHCKCTVYIKFT